MTNALELPPGVLAELYRRRWEIEKVFDQFKNKLGQKQAWGSSLVAQETQARFLIRTHNRRLIYEQGIESRHGVENQAEDQRRNQRTAQMIKRATNQGTPLSTLVIQARRAPQRSVKFVRWRRQSLRDQLTEASAVLQLRLLYAK